MSDLLIKGMELPKDDILRIEICPDGQVNRIIGWALSEPKRGKAVELPEHGDLIDRNKLSDGIYYDIDELYYAIDKAPVIVEANNGSDD